MSFAEASRTIYKPVRVFLGTPMYERAMQICWHSPSYKSMIALMFQLLRHQQKNQLPSEVTAEAMSALLAEKSKEAKKVQLWQSEMEGYDADVRPLLQLVWKVNNSMKMRDIVFEARRLLNSPKGVPPHFEHAKIINQARRYARILTKQQQKGPESKLLCPMDVVLEVLPKVLQGFWLPPPNTSFNMPSEQLSKMAVGVTKAVQDRVSKALSSVLLQATFSSSIRDNMVLSIQEKVRQGYPEDALVKKVNSFAAEVQKTITDVAVKEICALFQPQTPQTVQTPSDEPPAQTASPEPDLAVFSSLPCALATSDEPPAHKASPEPDLAVVSSPPCALAASDEPPAQTASPEPDSAVFSSPPCAPAASDEPPAHKANPEPDSAVVSSPPHPMAASDEPPAHTASPEPDSAVFSSLPCALAASDEPPAHKASPEPDSAVVSSLPCALAASDEPPAHKASPEPDSAVVSSPPHPMAASDEPPAHTASPEPDSAVFSSLPCALAASDEPPAHKASPEPDSAVVSSPPCALAASDEPPAHKASPEPDSAVVSSPPHPMAASDEPPAHTASPEPDSAVFSSPPCALAASDEPPAHKASPEPDSAVVTTVQRSKFRRFVKWLRKKCCCCVPPGDNELN